MKLAFLLAIVASASLASEPPSAVNGNPTTKGFELRPACEAGHDDALTTGVLTIRPGQTICVQLRVDGDKVVPLAVVSIDGASNTLIVKSWSEADGPETFLSIYNPLDTFLRFELNMHLPGARKPKYTSSCPALPGGSGNEQWPFQVDAFSMSGFRLLPESEYFVCR